MADDDLRQKEQSPGDKYGGKYNDPYGGQYGSDNPNHYRKTYGSDRSEGGDESSEPSGDLYKPDSPADIAAKEKKAGGEGGKDDSRVGKGHTDAGEQSFSVRGLFRTRKRKLIGLGGGVAVGGIIGFMLFFLPILRLEGYFADINRRVFVTAESAVQNRMQNLFERFMVMRVANIQACGNSISAGCFADYSNKGVFGAAFNVWRDAKLDTKLIDKFGLKITKYQNPVGGKLYKIVDVDGRWGGAPGAELTIENGQLKLGEFKGGDRIFGKEFRKFFVENTHESEILQRRSFRKLFVRKYGTKFWCLFACKTKDNIDLKIKDAKTRLKYKMVERLIYPFSSKYGLLMDCIIKGDACTPEQLRAQALDRNVSLTDQEMKDLEPFLDRENLRLSQVILEGLFSKIVGATAAKEIVGAIPIAGQIYLALSITDMFDQADRCVANNCLSKYAAEIRMSQYIEYYQVMRSANDEMKAGVLKAAEVGALGDQFGGDHPAEESLVFQTYHGTSQTSNQTASSGVVYAAVAAATNQKQKTPYVCPSGKPIPQGELVCPEKKVNQTFIIEDIRNNPIVSTYADYFNKYDCLIHLPVIGCVLSPQWFIHPTLQFINQVLAYATGPLVQGLIDAIKALPYIGDFVNWVSDHIKEMIQMFLDKIFPLPVQVTSPGREKWDGLQAGGEASASDFGKGGYTASGQAYGLGGQKLSPTQSAAILQQYNAQQQYNYQHSGFFARLTSLDNPGSVASRFVAIMPSSLNQLSSRFSMALAKPFSSLLAFSHPASAAVAPFTGSAFGIPQFGYPVNDPAFTRDPAELTPEYCAAGGPAEKTWEQSKTDDPITGIDQYSTTNPCLLEQVVAETATSAFTGNDCLDDSITPTSTCPTSSTPTGATP